MGLTSTGERLRAYLEYKVIGINQLGRMTNTSGAQISNIIAGKNYGVDKLISVFKACPDLDIKWLMTGAGEMITGQPAEVSTDDSAVQAHHLADEKEVKRLNQEIETLIREKEALQEAISYKDVSLDVYKHSLEALDATNRELRELLDHYKSIAMNQDKNNARSA